MRRVGMMAVLLGIAGVTATQAAVVVSVERISVNAADQSGNGDSGAVAGDGHFHPSAISRDGRFVAFVSRASNLVNGDTNGKADVFVRDRLTGATQRVSVSNTALQANGESYFPLISDDGRYVLFSSLASNLTPDDANVGEDVFLRDRQTGQTRRLSFARPEDGIYGGRSVGRGSMSGDGSAIVFNWAGGGEPGTPGNGLYHVDLATNARTLILGNDFGASRFGDSPAISRDGNLVVFQTDDELVVGDTNLRFDIYLYDVGGGTTERISVNDAGAQGSLESLSPEISADGRYVCFISTSPELTGLKSPAEPQVLVRDRQTNDTERVSGPWEGTYTYVDISGDGRFVTWEARGNTSAGDVMLHDRQLGTTERVSPSFGIGPAISGDGNSIVFAESSSLLPGGTDKVDVFAVDFEPADTNRPPVAHAGADGTVKTKGKKAKVTLDGTGSSDPDKDTLTFTWREGKTQIATGATPIVKLKKGVHTLTLEVRDPGGLSDTDEVVITVKKKKRR